jgi:hydroxyacylglutathione hydrolase
LYFRQIFEPHLAQYSYLIGCQQSGEAIVFDPMRDIHQYITIAKQEKLRIIAAADTHIHADYVSGLREFADRGITAYASDEGDEDWKYEWLINSAYSYRLLKHNDSFRIGKLVITALHTPGHTPEHIIFAVTDEGGGAREPMGYLTGDFVFVGDVGRPDLLESAAGYKDVMLPSAKALYASLLEFMKLPGYRKIWPGHGAGSACGKSLGAVPDSTIGYELRYNLALLNAESEEKFIRYILKDQPEPPLYFARMKRINKFGPTILGELPLPKRIDYEALKTFVRNTDVALIDTRRRREFLKGHIPGSVFSPLDNQFNTTAGCYVEADKPVYLIIDEHRLRHAVRDLVNVGLDNIEGYATPDDLRNYFGSGGESESTETIHISEIDALRGNNSLFILDVRKRSEYEEGSIEGAVNIPHTRLLEKIREIPRDTQIVVYCATGSRSAVASALLQRYGFNVIYAEGDIYELAESGYTLS